jgi:hypothetical protein
MKKKANFSETLYNKASASSAWQNLLLNIGFRDALKEVFIRRNFEKWFYKKPILFILPRQSKKLLLMVKFLLSDCP